jgi:predicted Zn finger-like uncharacterized protein
MSLVTRCPACGTTFRVLPAQLSARAGRVRCGKCAGVFDGVTNLLTDEAIAALPVEASPQMGLFEIRETAEAALPGEAIPQADASPKREVPQQEKQGRIEEAPEIETVPEPEPSAVTKAPQPAAPSFLAPERPRSSHSVVWALLALFAAGALAMQAALAFRTEIAVLWPPARPHIEAACVLLGCEVRLPRRADLMSIESSDLQADTQRQGVIVLNALLRNRAPFAQEYPDLELTLTDQGDQPLLRRVLRPGDYLREKRSAIATGLGGGAEEAVRIRLETGGLLATGYQLFLFYPCPAPQPSAYWQLSYPVRCQVPRNK